MEFIIGFLTGLGLVIGVLAILNNHKKLGITEIILAFLTPFVIYLFVQEKSKFAFGGTDFEFLIQTATVDKMSTPILIFMLFLSLIFLTVLNIYKLSKQQSLKE